MSKTAKTQAEEFATEAQKSVEKGVETLTKNVEDATSFGQENVEAIVTSSKIAAKAVENVNAEIFAYSKKSYESSLAAAKELGTCKSVTELVEKQTAFGKSAVEDFIAGATRINEMLATAGKEMVEPLNTRVNASVSMMKGQKA